jgi:hypothetical protein
VAHVAGDQRISLAGDGHLEDPRRPRVARAVLTSASISFADSRASPPAFARSWARRKAVKAFPRGGSEDSKAFRRASARRYVPTPSPSRPAWAAMVSCSSLVSRIWIVRSRATHHLELVRAL